MDKPIEKNKHSPDCKWHKDWHTCNCGHFEKKQQLKKYRICYRMECLVEATNEDKAMQKYENGESTKTEYVEFMSIEELGKTKWTSQC